MGALELLFAAQQQLSSYGGFKIGYRYFFLQTILPGIAFCMVSENTLNQIVVLRLVPRYSRQDGLQK